MKIRVIMSLLVFALLVSAGLTSCQVTITNTVTSSSISGTVVDARSYTGAGLAGVSVTITSISDSTYTATATTDSTGYYGFTGLDSTKSPYTLTSSLSGYFIPPVRVNQNGYNIVMDPIPAMQLNSNDLGGISFLTIYNKKAASIDSYLSFPDSDQSSTEPAFTSPYADTLSDLRSEVYYSSPVFPAGSTTSTATVYLDNGGSTSSNTSGASSLTLRTLPFNTSTYTAPSGSTANYPLTMNSSSDLNGLYSAFHSSFGTDTVSFRYMGAAELYLNASSGTLSTSASVANNPDLTVYCVQTSGTKTSPTATLINAYTLPETMSTTSVSVARVNLLLYWDQTTNNIGVCYELVPDSKVIPQGPLSTSTPFKAVWGSTIQGVLGPQLR